MIHTRTITGSAATVALSTDGKEQAQWLDIFVPAGNSGTVQTGDTSVSSTVGRVIAKGAAFLYPPVHRGGYALTGVFVYVASNDTAIITWQDFD